MTDSIMSDQELGGPRTLIRAIVFAVEVMPSRARCHTTVESVTVVKRNIFSGHALSHGHVRGHTKIMSDAPTRR